MKKLNKKTPTSNNVTIEDWNAMVDMLNATYEASNDYVTLSTQQTITGEKTFIHKSGILVKETNDATNTKKSAVTPTTFLITLEDHTSYEHDAIYLHKGLETQKTFLFEPEIDEEGNEDWSKVIARVGDISSSALKAGDAIALRGTLEEGRTINVNIEEFKGLKFVTVNDDVGSALTIDYDYVASKESVDNLSTDVSTLQSEFSEAKVAIEAAINAETERATAAEKDISDKLVSETDRATAREAELATSISDEESARVDADTALNERVDTESKARADKDAEILENLNTHIEDKILHITADERTAWNNKSVVTASTQAIAGAETVYSFNIDGTDYNLPIGGTGDVSKEYVDAQDAVLRASIEENASAISQETANRQTGDTDTLTAAKEYTDATVKTYASHYITKNSAGDSFATQAELVAGPWYHGGKVYTPTENDYAIVLADETHDNKRYRYVFDGEAWSAQYPIDMDMSAEQILAINSGITAAKVTTYQEHIEDADIHVTAELKGKWSAKQDAIDDSNKLSASYVSGLATVATSGKYGDLDGIPTIPDAQIPSDWDQPDTTKLDYIKNKPTKATSISGSGVDTDYVTSKAVVDYISNLTGDNIDY